MERQDFVEQFAELVARVKRIERWQDQWASRDRRVQSLIANEVRLNDSGSGYHAGFKAGASLIANFVLTLPTADGDSGFPLVTDGAGSLSFNGDLWSRLVSAESEITRGCRQFKNIGLQASVSVIPAKAGIQNPVAGKYAFAANGLWIPAFAGMTVNMTTLPSITTSVSLIG